jgi:uridine kinase
MGGADCTRLGGPYCALAVEGESGSGKTTLCHMLRKLLDANAAPHRATPRNEDDLIAFDNVSRISKDMADAICRLATEPALASESSTPTMMSTSSPLCARRR